MNQSEIKIQNTTCEKNKEMKFKYLNTTQYFLRLN